MALFEKFGEMDSAEEIQAAAEGLLNEGDMESLKALAKENGFDEDDVEDWEDFGVVITPAQAAVGKLMIEADDLKFPKDIEKQLNALRREFMAEDTNAGMIQMYLDGFEGDYVCVAQIYQEALHNPFTDPSRRDSIEITDIMRHSIEGWQPGPVHRFEKYGRQRSWVRVNQVCQPNASDPQAAVPDDDGFIEVPDDPDNPFITKDEPIRMRPP